MACVTASEVSSLVSAQVPQIQEDINYYIALETPYSNILDGATFASNQGDDIINAVTNRVSPGHSLTRPHFTDRANACGLEPSQDQIGQTVFTTKIGTLRGKGPDVCVKQAVEAVKNSYTSAERALKENLAYTYSVDVRSQIHDLGGVKFVARTGTDFDTLLTGGLNQVSTTYYTQLPNAPMTVQALEALTQYMDDELRLTMYGSGAKAHYKVITGRQQNSFFRNQLSGEGRDLTATLQGSFGEGKDAIWGYEWTDVTYRGFSLGIDFEPLRFNCYSDGTDTTKDGVVIPAGMPVFIEPVIDAAGDAGRNGARNPEYNTAKYEVGFLVAPNSFTRYVPEQYTGEGSFRFAPQMAAAMLEWFYSRDCNNQYGDVGWHLYQIERGYSAQQPHGVIGFAYARAPRSLGLEVGDLYSNSTVCAS